MNIAEQRRSVEAFAHMRHELERIRQLNTELYEALAAIERSTDYGADDDRPLMRAARAALAKARGKTP